MINRLSGANAVIVLAGGVAAVVSSGLYARPAIGATITVTSTAERLGDGKCGLAEAMRAINSHATYDSCKYSGNSADIIVVPAGNYTEAASMPGTKSVTIEASPSTTPVISGTGTNQKLFDFSETTAGMKVVLSGLDLVGAGSQVTGISAVGQYDTAKLSIVQCIVYNFDNSGVVTSGFNLDVEDSNIEFNSSSGGGAGITTDATLTIANSSVSNNDAATAGGGIYFDGFGTSTVMNSTVSFNTAADGAGIFLGNIDEQPDDSFAIYASTLAFNAASAGSGGGVEALVRNYDVTASILSNNTDTTYGPSDWVGSVASISDSLMLSTNGTSIVTQTHNLFAQDPQLFHGITESPVWDGGKFYVPVLPLQLGSPAIDFLASVSKEATDARHFPRGVASGGGKSTHFDIGAMEFDPHIQAETLVVIPSQSGAHLPTTVSASGYSNGQGSWLDATSTKDFVSYQIPIYHDFTNGQPAQVHVGVKKGNNEGIVTLSWANLPLPNQPFVWHTIGSIDLYSSTTSFTNVTVGAPTMFTTDTTYFKFQVTGQNRSSSGFQVFLDYIDLVL